MERWEHLILESAVTQRGSHLMTTDGNGTLSVLSGLSAMPHDVLTALNELGQQGWQLVSIERTEDRDGAVGTYWLERRTA